jgi:hypothetical protein
MNKKKLYLTATYYRVPKANVRTNQKDFGKNDDNWVFNEQVAIVRSLKRRDQDYANIILNITDKKVQKCNMRENVGYDELYRYFKTNYPQYFQHIDAADDPAYFQRLNESAPADPLADPASFVLDNTEQSESVVQNP